MTTAYAYDPLWDANVIAETTREQAESIGDWVDELSPGTYRIGIIVEASHENLAYEQIERLIETITDDYSIGPVRERGIE